MAPRGNLGAVMRGVTVVLVWGAFGLAACGSSESNTSSPGPTTANGGAVASGGAVPNGGAVANGGGGSGNGGSVTAGQGGLATGGVAGSAAGSAPLRDACRAYVVAYCERQIECTGGSIYATESCVASADACPDLLLSSGSGHSLQNLLDCIEPLRTADCSDWRRDILPACVTAGTRARGASCAFRSQCQSQSCNQEENGAPCGFCRGLAEPGGACNDYETACPPGQRCEGSRCVEIPPSADPVRPTPSKRVAEGEACGFIRCEGCDAVSEVWCELGLYCSYPEGSGEGVCRAFPAPGEPCAEDLFPSCAEGAYCSPTGCLALPVAGEACASGASPQCADGLYCVSGLCAPLAAVGEQCEPDPTRLVASVCQTGLVCACQDAECRMGACQNLAREGTACGADGVVCEHGTVCEGGLCRPSDALTTQAICDQRE